METSLNWNGTKEKVTVEQGNLYGEYVLKVSPEIDWKESNLNEAEANAQLFTDALHTIQECDLMPSQLRARLNDETQSAEFWMNKCKEFQEENAKLKDELSDKAETNASLTILLSEEKEKTNKLKEALKDKDFIISALNAYWYEAILTFSRETSGDIERDQAKKQMDKAKTLMNQLELLNS